jgi:hypothetical protein
MALPHDGDGSEQNPYQITTADEFMTVVETKDKFGILMNDIDFNNSNFYNITQYICWRATSIDGQGHTVSNIFMKDINAHNIWFKMKDRTDSDARAKTRSIVKNITLEMVFVKTIGSSGIGYITDMEDGGGYVHVDFENVDFRITYYQANNDNNISLFRGDSYNSAGFMNFTYCVFNISVIATSGGFNDFVIFRSAIRLNSCQVNVTYQSSVNNSEMTVYDSITATYNIATFIHFNDTTTYKINVYKTTVNNSYVVADNLIANPDPTSPCHTVSICSGTANSVVFYDKDAANPTTSTPNEYKITIIDDSSANVYDLTTAQCKNATHLNTIGFIIAV